MPHQLELAVTVIILAGSALLFVYWFRYTCLLILSAKTAEDYAADFAAAARLSFRDVQASLQDRAMALDPLHAALERDFAVVGGLIKNVGQSGEDQFSLEARMLGVYYRLMQAAYRVASPLSTEAARHALEQMSMVVGYFANVLGENAVSVGAAA
jgi:hypothetical protein